MDKLMRGGGFLQIEKVTELKAERGMQCWLQTSNLTPTRKLFWNGVWRRDWSNGMGVGKVRGSHRIKVREALDLVTF
jgi:hypothetical protein